MTSTENQVGTARVWNVHVTGPGLDENDPEYERFEALATNLVQVPKRELDEKLRSE